MYSQIFCRSRPLAVRKFHESSVVNTAKPSPLIDSIIRVDHAGELGADRIYAGQMAVLGNTKMGPLIQHMWDQEKVHKSTFENLIVKHRVRPTALVPVWNVAGFLLGAGTALMGEKAAMACTVAVESVIVDHYNDQLRELMAEPEKNKELMQTIQKFRDEEQEHHDCGIDHGAEQAPFYRALSEVIKFGCKAAINLSKGLLSHRNQCYSITCRSYSTSSETNKIASKWDLFSGICLERKPVIMKPLTEMEEKVTQLLLEIETEVSYKSDHEIKAEEDMKRKNKRGQEKLDFNPILEQTAHEFEEISDKEFKAFTTAPLLTADDKKNNVRSLNRNLASHLLLLVKQNVGGRDMWILPHGIRKDSETMRDTAERVLQEKCGDKLNVLFLGNAPCGFYKWTYPQKIGNSIGAKVFFFKALYLSGHVALEGKEVSDYQWATRMDLKKLLVNDKYYKKVSRFLIEDDVDEAEENRESVLRKAKQKT